MYDLCTDSQIDLRLTTYPREIILLYHQKVFSANPDWDDLIVARMDVDDPDTEFYTGPGYVNRHSGGEDNWRRVSLKNFLSTFFYVLVL